MFRTITCSISTLLLLPASVTAAETKPSGAMFSEATKEVIPFEEKSRRKWDSPVIADFDQDGHMDILITEHTNKARLFWNNGGTFSEALDIVHGDTHGVAVGDYDQDGLTEMIIYHGGGGGKNPRNPMAFNLDGRTVDKGTEFVDFERSRGRASKFLDFDGDGRLDLLISSLPLKTQPDGCNQLFRNASDGRFELVAKLPQAMWMGFRTLVTDFNNDNIPDVIFYGGDNMVAIQGAKDGKFTDVSTKVLGELAKTSYATSLAEIDYDNDGDFDLVITRADHPFGEKTDCCPEHSRFAFFGRGEKNSFQYDLKINGDLKIKNLQMAFPDFDVFAGAEKRQLDLKGQKGAEREFTLKPEEAQGYPEQLTANGLYSGYIGEGMWRVGGRTASPTTGVIHNVQEHPEVTDPKSFPALLLENRDGVFTDVTAKLGFSIQEQTAGSAVGDFDNDGWTDIFIVREGNPADSNEQILYLNENGTSFARADNHGIISKELGATGCGAEVIDFNEDGKLDLIFSNERGLWHLFQNEAKFPESGNFVVVKVGMSPSGKATSHGAVLTINAGGQIYKRVVGMTSSPFSQSQNTHLHVGLGEVKIIDKANVRWTNGETEELTISEINRSFSAGKYP
ncbi:MAG: CRTAC1 family protein [Luteolibacter sp.]